MVSGTLWAGNTPLGLRGAQAEQSFGNLVSNQLTLGPSTLEVRAAVTLTVPLGGPVGQALGFNAAVCQCLRNGSASAQRETRMASQNVAVLSKLSLGREPQATSKPARTPRVVLICQTGSRFTDTSSMNPKWVGSLPICFNMDLWEGFPLFFKMLSPWIQYRHSFIWPKSTSGK